MQSVIENENPPSASGGKNKNKNGNETGEATKGGRFAPALRAPSQVPPLSFLRLLFLFFFPPTFVGFFLSTC